MSSPDGKARLMVPNLTNMVKEDHFRSHLDGTDDGNASDVGSGWVTISLPKKHPKKKLVDSSSVSSINGQQKENHNNK